MMTGSDTTTGDLLRMTMRLWASGVTVVTTARGEQRAGMTVSAFASVALEPPLILVSLYKGAETCRLIEEAGFFAVSILGAEQAALSAQFAGFTDLPAGADRFYQVETVAGTTGAPILTEAIAWLDCRLYDTHNAGTHRIVIGEVVATGRQEGAAPLLYFNRGYHVLAPQGEQT